MIELLQLSQVLNVVRATGTEVRYHHEDCATNKAAGWYRLGPNVDRLVICPDNQLNHSDLFDTVRHEAIHVVQACKGSTILPYDYYIKNTPEHIKTRVFNGYPKRSHHVELEAFTGAYYLSEGDVIQLLKKWCFN